MTYVQLGIIVAEFFISTIFLVYSFTTLWARKPVHLFGKKFANRSIVDADGFNRINAYTLLLMAVPGYMGGAFVFIDYHLGLLVSISAYVVGFLLGAIIMNLNFKMHVKRLIKNFMFQTSKNNTIVKFELFQKGKEISAFEYLSINGKANVIETTLKRSVYNELQNFIEDYDLESWNGFHESTGEPGKGVEWKIKITYDDRSVIFAYGKDAYPLAGKATLEKLNNLLNENFINKKSLGTKNN